MYPRLGASQLPSNASHFFQQLESTAFQLTSPGPGNGQFPIGTDTDGRLDVSFMPESIADHVLESLDGESPLHFAPPSSSFVSSPDDGQHQRRTDLDYTFGYDSGRTRWYASPFPVSFGFPGAVLGGDYGTKEGVTCSASLGWYVPYDCVLLGIAWQMAGAVVGNWEVHRGGSSVYSVSHNAAASSIQSLNVSLGAGAPLAVGNASGTVTNAVVTLYLARSG